MMCHPVSTAAGPVRCPPAPHATRLRPIGPRPIGPRPIGLRAGRLARYLNTAWLAAAAGVVILIVSMALMAYSAPGHALATARPEPPSHARVHLDRAPAPGHPRPAPHARLQPVPGPLPGPGRHPGSELRPSR